MSKRSIPGRHRLDSRVSIGEHAAPIRLLCVAETDTAQARRVAGFLLAWWNPMTCGRFDLIDLWMVDLCIQEDVFTVLRMAVRTQ